MGKGERVKIAQRVNFAREKKNKKSYRSRVRIRGKIDSKIKNYIKKLLLKKSYRPRVKGM